MDPETTVLIRSCTFGTDAADEANSTGIALSRTMENPKISDMIFEGSLHTSPACYVDGDEADGELDFFASSGTVAAPSGDISKLLDGMRHFFEAKGNCDESLLFAYSRNLVAGIYLGAGLGKPTVSSGLEAVSRRLATEGTVANRTVAQVCRETQPELGFGVAIDTTGNIAAVQRATLGWSMGICTRDQILDAPARKLSTTIHSIAHSRLASNDSTGGNHTIFASDDRTPRLSSFSRRNKSRRGICSYLRIESGDGCASLAAKCGIRGAQFVKFNPQPDLCSTLMPGDYVCCSEGDPYVPPKPSAPQPGEDGTCAVHLIENGDTCASLAQKYGISVSDIEGFNKNNTWAWTECKQMLLGYNMCLSKGRAPLPPPQNGAHCGPLVPGTEWTDKSTPMADLNPCPLKACCSNWGFCGPFAAHCDIHAPPDGGPGSKLPGFQNTCVSNCGNEIKQNSGPPENFGRVAYYESWNLERDCLWLNAENANTDGTYSIVHWAFIGIDKDSFKPVIKDPSNQWEGFKKLQGVKRVVSFGGWAYSTEPATYNIIRSAIIANRETFATNIAQFLEDEDLDGVDIDWEYPGAPDIEVGGVPIGQRGDGVAYLRFLTTLKNKLPNKSVSIAAPASYWYLKAFPIDRIAAVIDYIVYMTYDLHGQWDYGNPNAFDACDSGKCIRSHVNLTETRNTLSIITKAGVPNNKIYVGESSYGRSFHMATDGCWGPSCEFTGSKTQSDAAPGRCTKTGGYLSNAEINEILKSGQGRQLHDGDSNTDILLYKGDYVSYMTPTTKNTRRSDWKDMNFAGSIDWAVDLQAFGQEDMNAEPERPETEEGGCIKGEAVDLNSGDLCEFSCDWGFCPEAICICLMRGKMDELPPVVDGGDFMAWNQFDVELNRLCKFACKYGYCPADICTTPVIDELEDPTLDDGTLRTPTTEADLANRGNCFIFKDPTQREATMRTCRSACGIKYGETAKINYGCVAFFPGTKEIPWEVKQSAGGMVYVPGKCSCDNWLVNEVAEFIIDALPVIAQIGCYMVMSAFKFVLDVGLQFIPGVGKVLDAGLDMVTVAAKVAAYAYPEDERPEDAFSWWLSPCGGTDLVPDEIKKVFDILNSVADGVSSFTKPKFKRGSGKKGDDANPTDRATPKAGTGGGKNGKGSNNGVSKPKRKCHVPPKSSKYIMGALKNTVRSQWCANDVTEKEEYVATSINYGPTPFPVKKTCKQHWAQACYHYSSVIDTHPQWSTILCPVGSGKTKLNHDRPAPKAYYDQLAPDWKSFAIANAPDGCDADEYPPAALLDKQSPIFQNAGQNDQGQLIRYIPDKMNRGAGGMFKGVCFAPVSELTPDQLVNKIRAAPPSKQTFLSAQNPPSKLWEAEIDVDSWPEFSIDHFEHSPGLAPAPDYGLYDNDCWPRQQAAGDPGFALLSFDPWYKGAAPRYDYGKPYVKGSNGS